MGTYLNIGMMQSGDCSSSFEYNLKRIKKETRSLMMGMNAPELVVGIELGIGTYWAEAEERVDGDPIPGKVTEELSKIAKEYGIYFLPGSMFERVEEDGKVKLYNSIPIFGPDGELIDVHRKMCPYYPVESHITKGEKYVTFDIKEKGIKIGVLNCHDWCFPEISRNLALMGAEILIRPAMDPEGLYDSCKGIAPTRAFENQAYFVSLNCAGKYLGTYNYGKSCIAGPDGRVLYETGSNPMYFTMTFDVDRVRDARRYGTNYTDQLMRQLKAFNPPQPFANHIGDAPIYENLPDPDYTFESRAEMFAKEGLMSIGKK